MHSRFVSASRLAVFALALFLLACGAIVPIQAQAPTQTYTFISSFTGNPAPKYPVGALVQGRDGYLYGSSYYGGTSDDGSIFKVSLSGAITVVHDFTSTEGGPCYSSFLLNTDGNFYGTCSGGSSGDGFVFKVTPAGVLTKLHTFTGSGTDGNGPGPLTLGSDGNFYGITVTGGTNNLGTFYKITASGTLTTIYSFTSSNFQPNYDVIQGTDGNFYGGTGSSGTAGSIFKITSAGVLTTLHTFTGDPDGYDPSGLIQGKDGNFYGVTRFGGSNNEGIIFKMTSAGTLTILHSFNATSDIAAYPVTPLVQGPDGNFYSQTCDDNTFGSCGGPNHEALYEITPSGTYMTVHVFTGPPSDGQQPFATLTVDTNGTLYSFTEEGGSAGDGAFYSLNIGAKAFITLQSISGKVGAKVGIFGQGFSSSTVVKFNGVAAAKPTLSGTTYLTATVPTGASDGFVTVTTGTSTLTSTVKFTVHDSWGAGAVMPTGVQWPMSATIGSKIYVVGGYTATAAIANNQIYNPTTNTWSTGTAFPTPMAQGATAVVNNVLYVFGGSSNGGSTVTNAVWAYNPTTNAWTAKSAMPTARCSMTAVVEKGIAYVIGGYNGSRLNTVEAYNPTTDSWTTEATLLTGKSEISAGLIGTTIVAADGFASGGVTGDTEAYNATTNVWSTLSADPTFRNGACAGAIGGSLYASDGNDNSNNAIVKNESFTLSSNKWTTLTSMPQAVTDAGPAVYSGQLFCFGGASFANAFRGTVYNNVQIYQP